MEILSPSCALVGMVLGKNDPYVVLGVHVLDQFALTAHMNEVEAIVNNHPIAYVSTDTQSSNLISNLLVTGKPSVADPVLSPPKIPQVPEFDKNNALNMSQSRARYKIT